MSRTPARPWARRSQMASAGRTCSSSRAPWRRMWLLHVCTACSTPHVHALAPVLSCAALTGAAAKGAKAPVRRPSADIDMAARCRKLKNDLHAPDKVEPAVRESLKKLRVDYVDLLHIHWPFDPQIAPVGLPLACWYCRWQLAGRLREWAGPACIPSEGCSGACSPCQGSARLSPACYAAAPQPAPLQETWKAMEACVDKGLVRSIGISNFSPKKTDRWFGDARIQPAVNQVEVVRARLLSVHAAAWPAPKQALCAACCWAELTTHASPACFDGKARCSQHLAPALP